MGILLLYYLWAVVAISGTCGFVNKIADEDRMVLDEIEASVDFKNIINECFYKIDSREKSENDY